ncbi:hypothetical protein HPB50_026026 [Hyalomma asiaticum]|uniref:Uncharacterized protein n=1 Tax=Hyalomma asiaticum TaxID=266040 RepID=A0ACB7TNV4_HYAAI|nr:hypothetical protein HPB50_026026 [Hyalomma asiaticum]
MHFLMHRVKVRNFRNDDFYAGRRVAAKKPLLSGQNKIARLRFAIDHRSWSVDDWKSVIFSDESAFSTRWDQQQRVWRLEGTPFTQQNSKHVAGSGRTAVNVWGAISFPGLGPLVRIEGKFNSAAYCDILEYVLIPYVLDGPWPDGYCHYQHDLSPVYTAKRVRTLLDALGVNCLEWPPKAADINIIENVWGLIKSNLSKRSLNTLNADELWEAIQEEWLRLQQDNAFVEALYRSLPSRMECVIQSGGGMTRY